MKTIYHVYVDAESVPIDGILHKLKKEFNRYFDKKDALAYKERLEERFENVVIEEKKIRDNPFG